MSAMSTPEGLIWEARYEKVEHFEATHIYSPELGIVPVTDGRRRTYRGSPVTYLKEKSNSSLSFRVSTKALEDSLPMYAVYLNPSDFPGKVVVRLWVSSSSKPKPTPQPEHWVFDTLEGARALDELKGLNAFSRLAKDDECIVEVWL